MTKASRDTQIRRNGKKGSYEQASRDPPGRGVYLSVTFRNTPKKARREEGKGRGRKGIKVATGSNEP